MKWIDDQVNKVGDGVNNAVDEKVNAIGEKIWWHLYDVMDNLWQGFLDLASVIVVVCMIWFIIKMMILKNKQDSMNGLFVSAVAYIIVAMMIRLF